MINLPLKKEYGPTHTVLSEQNKYMYPYLINCYSLNPYFDYDLSATNLRIEDISQNTGVTGYYVSCSDVNRLSVLKNEVAGTMVAVGTFGSPKNLTAISKEHIRKNYYNAWTKIFEERFNASIKEVSELANLKTSDLEEKPNKSLFGNYELELNEQEADKLINYLQEDSNKESEKIFEKSLELYNKMKRKEDLYNKKKLK